VTAAETRHILCCFSMHCFLRAHGGPGCHGVSVTVRRHDRVGRFIQAIKQEPKDCIVQLAVPCPKKKYDRSKWASRKGEAVGRRAAFA
jgi:hypothetical protein